jgi:5-(carboxyamino)imidazole ribonucleotide synthase
MNKEQPFPITRGAPRRDARKAAPGATIGILGGGQLGRMLAVAAAQLGCRTHIYAPESDSVAAEVSADFTCADWHDAEAMARFARSCDMITWEFENVPVGPLEAIPPAKLRPDPRALEIAQDRLAEKRFVEELGGRAAAHAEVDSRDDLEKALARIGVPGILKTRREGYDGKGQWAIGSEREAEGLSVHEGGFVYEGRVQFEGEFSVILARGADGAIRFWDSPENVHQSGILTRSSLPAPQAILDQVEQARELGRSVAEALNYVGVLALEFFATPQGPVFNEMAPRVHNSGHWTIEGSLTSQFENHIRAILGLPLGDTALTAPRIEMKNLIGPEALDAYELLAEPANHLHLYGKAEAREGRKMGHVTRLERD